MDYGAVYERFILDRAGKQPARPAYFERHHIVPRKLGGGDEVENIIRLTPEDHFFAHLLLAKIHGGEMWAPVAFMVGGSRKDYVPTQSRKRRGWVIRAMAKAKSGEGAHQFDHAEYALHHVDGGAWCGKQSEMQMIGLSRSLANMLIKGRVKSARGWYLDGAPVPNRSGPNHPGYRPEKHTFCHVDGREFTGSQYEFHVAHGVSKPAACKLARGTAKVWNGWHLKGATLPTTGRASRWRPATLAQTATLPG